MVPYVKADSSHSSQCISAWSGDGEGVADAPYPGHMAPTHPVPCKSTMGGFGRRRAVVGQNAQFVLMAETNLAISKHARFQKEHERQLNAVRQSYQEL